MDTGSPVESRGSLRGGVLAKHGGRKSLQATRKARETGRGGEEGEVGEGEGLWTGGVEPGWETMPPGMGGTGKVGQGPSRGRLSSTGGWEGGVVPSHVMEDLPSRASPTLSRGSAGHFSDDGEGDSDGLSDDSDSSGGTVISLSTSLPIKFSGLTHQQHRPSPLAMAVSSSAAGTDGSSVIGGGGGGGGGGDGLDVVSVAQSVAHTKLSPSGQGEKGSSKRQAPLKGIPYNLVL